MCYHPLCFKANIATATDTMPMSTKVPGGGVIDQVNILPGDIILQKETSGAVKAVALIALMCYIAAYAIGFGPGNIIIIMSSFISISSMEIVMQM